MVYTNQSNHMQTSFDILAVSSCTTVMLTMTQGLRCSDPKVGVMQAKCFSKAMRR